MTDRVPVVVGDVGNLLFRLSLRPRATCLHLPGGEIHLQQRHHVRNIGLERFTLRGKQKVDAQWKLYCIVHNLLKMHRYGEVFG